MERRKFAISNWKMNFTWAEVNQFLSNFDIPKGISCEVVICAPFIYLQYLVQSSVGSAEWSVGAEDVSAHDVGAYTGEISAAMLASINVQYAIVGHSERRQYFGEDSTLLVKKIKHLLAQNINPIFCVGEPLEIVEQKRHFKFIEEQIQQVLSVFTKEEVSKMIIAYEPVWAIGTGKVASPDQAEEMHLHIRRCIASSFDESLAQYVSILYGGSVKASNADELFSRKNVDGALIGGASLDPIAYATIIGSLARS